jgi:hypothetical protein
LTEREQQALEQMREAQEQGSTLKDYAAKIGLDVRSSTSSEGAWCLVRKGAFGPLPRRKARKSRKESAFRGACGTGTERHVGHVPAGASGWLGARLVDLHDLPQRYSCDDLWYKFRDVLLAMGGRPDIKILVYRCERGLPDGQARSPEPS